MQVPESYEASKRATTGSLDPWSAVVRQGPKSIDTKNSKIASKLSLEDQSLMNTAKLRELCDAFNKEQLQVKAGKVSGQKRFERLMND